MSKIDISNWKEFQVGQLFTILNGKGITKNEIYEHPGQLPAIQSGEEDFGCIGHLDYDYCISQNYTISKGACLTVARSGSSGYVGYQSQRCVVGDSAKILEPKFEANKERLLFIRALLMINKAKYAYTDKVTRENYERDTIKLPVLENEQPDWWFMEKYIQKIEEQQAYNLKQLQKLPPPKSLDVNSWNPIAIGSLFRLEKGTRLTKADMKEGNINFIGASAVNNGITALIGNTAHLHPANTITVNYNGSVGEAFYQTQPFWASDDVNVLYPQFKMTRDIALFLLPIIRKVGKRYAFENKWKLEEMENETIFLPCDLDGQPDYAYMTAFIQQRTGRLKQGASNLTSKCFLHKPSLAKKQK